MYSRHLSESNMYMIQALVGSSNYIIHQLNNYNKISTEQYDVLFKNNKQITVTDKIYKKIYASLYLAYKDHHSNN